MLARTPQRASKVRYRVLDVAFCAAFVGVGSAIGVDVLEGLSGQTGLIWLVVPIALAGYIAADFASGFVHWLADTYGSPSTPLLGPKLVTPFREHHDDPGAICRHDFLEANGDNCMISQFVLLPTYAFVPAEDGGWATALSLFVLALALGVLLTSIVHGWAHHHDPPRIARWLQKANLVLSAERHALHHRSPHASHYCITTGWLNPLLDKTRFFRRFERLLSRLGVRTSA